MRILEEEKKSKLLESLQDQAKFIKSTCGYYIDCSKFFSEYPRLVRYFKCLAEDKEEQFQCLVEFINDRFGEQECECKENEKEPTDKLEVFELSVKAEGTILENYEQAFKEALEESDLVTSAYLIKRGESQFKTWKLMKEIYRYAKSEESSWLSKQIEIMNVYTLSK